MEHYIQTILKVLAAAIFFDRDGVLNKNVRYTDSNEWEAPRTVTDFDIVPGAVAAAASLQRAGYRLFLVSNQPNMAKGKAQQADHDAIHAELLRHMNGAGVIFQDVYYCFHHPKAVVSEWSGPCECRKPSSFFLQTAKKNYALDMTQSWMIGDRDTDIECGRAAGVRTIQISDRARHTLPQHPDYIAHSIVQAAQIILATS